MKKFITRKEVSAYLAEQGIQISVSQLCKYATFGSGPCFYKLGKKRVLYKPEDIDAWILANLSDPMESSSQNLFKEYKHDKH